MFVCFSSKATHLEIVSSLDVPPLIAIANRFISRQGKPRILYSNNASNFRRADRVIQSLFSDSAIKSHLASEGITWKFIPPHSPDFGGLWESHVWLSKRYLCKIVGNATLIYEELAMVTAKIEAVLNSRPLCPISSDVHDFKALTPVHFLILQAITGHSRTPISK